MLRRSVALTTLLCAGCVHAAEISACEVHDASAACETPADSSSLMQRQQHVQRQVPKSNLLPSWDSFKGMANGALKDVEATGIIQAVKALVQALDGPMEGILASAKNLTFEVQSERGNLTSGIAAILAKNFKVNQTDLYEGKEALIQTVQNEVQAAAASWKNICTASDGLTSTAGTLLAPLGGDKVKEALDKAMKSASEACVSVGNKFVSLEEQMVPKASEVVDEKVNALAGSFSVSTLLQKIRIPSVRDAKQVCADLNATMQSVLKSSEEFVSTFDEAFVQLQKGVGSAFSNEISADALGQVEDTLQRVTDKAKNITSEMLSATADFLSSLEDGVGTAGSAAGVVSLAPTVRAPALAAALAVLLLHML